MEDLVEYVSDGNLMVIIMAAIFAGVILSVPFLFIEKKLFSRTIEGQTAEFVLGGVFLELSFFSAAMYALFFSLSAEALETELFNFNLEDALWPAIIATFVFAVGSSICYGRMRLTNGKKFPMRFVGLGSILIAFVVPLFVSEAAREKMLQGMVYVGVVFLLICWLLGKLFGNKKPKPYTPRFQNGGLDKVFSISDWGYVKMNSNGSIFQVGDMYVEYRFDGRIYRIGNMYVEYRSNGSLYKIGDMYVEYGFNGKIFKIGDMYANY